MRNRENKTLLTKSTLSLLTSCKLATFLAPLLSAWAAIARRTCVVLQIQRPRACNAPPPPRATPPVVAAAAAAAAGYSTNAISSPTIWPRAAAAALVRIPPQPGMQQQQQPNVPPPVRLRVASVYAALLRLFGCFRVRNFHPRFLASPDPTRPDPSSCYLLLGIIFLSSLTPIFYCCYFPPTCFDWLCFFMNLFLPQLLFVYLLFTLLSPKFQSFYTSIFTSIPF